MQRIRLSLVAPLALTCLAGVTLASAQEALPPSDLLEAAYELHEGGRPLRRALFAKAWPTTAPYQTMTGEFSAAPADALLQSYLAGSVGPSLASSQWALERKELRNKEGDSFDDTRALLGSELLLLRYMSDLKSDTEGLQPTLYPLETLTRGYAGRHSSRRLGTWAWRPAQGKATLEGLGRALLLEARYGIEQLRRTREVQQAGKSVTLRGATPDEGFFGLLALQAAGAKAIELQRRLVYDVRKNEILRQESLLGLEPRGYLFPNRWTVGSEGEVLAYSDAEPESQLAAQSSVLLGAATLARELGRDDDVIRDALRPFAIRGQKIYLVDPEAHAAAIEVAVFGFRSILTLHVSLARGASACSQATPTRRGATVTPADFSTLIMALDAFLQIPTTTRGLDRDLSAALATEQEKARKLGAALVKNQIQWVREGKDGVFDKYDIDTNGRANANRSLSAQAYTIQGLVAGYSLSKNEDALRAAQDLTSSLDARYWDRASQAYVPVGRKATEAREAAALLGALRRVALATGDGRYLYRYRQYLTHLHEAGWFEEGSSSTPPGLRPEVELSQSK